MINWTSPNPSAPDTLPSADPCPFVRAREKAELTRWERFEQDIEKEDRTFAEATSRCAYEFGWLILCLCGAFLLLCWTVLGGVGGVK